MRADGKQITRDHISLKFRWRQNATFYLWLFSIDDDFFPVICKYAFGSRICAIRRLYIYAFVRELNLAAETAPKRKTCYIHIYSILNSASVS